MPVYFEKQFMDTHFSTKLLVGMLLLTNVSQCNTQYSLKFIKYCRGLFKTLLNYCTNLNKISGGGRGYMSFLKTLGRNILSPAKVQNLTFPPSSLEWSINTDNIYPTYAWTCTFII